MKFSRGLGSLGTGTHRGGGKIFIVMSAEGMRACAYTLRTAVLHSAHSRTGGGQGSSEQVEGTALLSGGMVTEPPKCPKITKAVCPELT